jgi:hypothetical protein
MALAFQSGAFQTDAFQTSGEPIPVPVPRRTSSGGWNRDWAKKYGPETTRRRKVNFITINDVLRESGESIWPEPKPFSVSWTDWEKKAQRTTQSPETIGPVYPFTVSPFTTVWTDWQAMDDDEAVIALLM